MNKLFISLCMLFSFYAQGVVKLEKDDDHSFAVVDTIDITPEANKQNNSASKYLSIIKEWQDNINATMAAAFTGMTDKEKAILALKVTEGQYDVNDKYTKYFWKPVSIISDMIKNLAVLGTVVIPSSSMLFNGNNNISQILSCACGVATLIFAGINGYSERKVVETMRLQLCLAAMRREGCA